MAGCGLARQFCLQRAQLLLKPPMLDGRVRVLGLVLLPSELALPTLALELLPPVLVGLILAGIFAATISTADSLVLACSSIVVCDLRRDTRDLRLAKWATLAVTAGALCWAFRWWVSPT